MLNDTYVQLAFGSLIMLVSYVLLRRVKYLKLVIPINPFIYNKLLYAYVKTI